MPKTPVLVVDIGGTSTRFARARGGKLDSVHTVTNGAFAGVPDLFRAAMKEFHPWRPVSCVLAVAGPVDSDHVLLTNRPWSFSQRELRQEFKLARMLVVNDFVAVANSLPLLKPAQLFEAGGGRIDRRRTALVCGPGTGFGSAALLKGKNRVQAMASESGHMRLGASTSEENDFLQEISRETGPVVVEHVLSGSGLARLHRVLTREQKTPEEIVADAHEGKKSSRATIDAFLKIFGRVAGDLALVFDARGGVFIAGGLGRMIGPFIPNSPFRAAFENHPPYQTRLATIPTSVIVHPNPGLLGAARLAAELPPRK